jgi:hypothetical protein
MSKTLLVWDGMAEYLAELRELPTACAGEAAKLVEAAVNGAEVDIKAAYPVRSGDLRDHVMTAPLVLGGLIVGSVVKNTSPIAIIFERGSEARHYITKNGVQHLTGRMPPGNVFVPRILQARRKLVEALKAAQVRRGATVTGDA